MSSNTAVLNKKSKEKKNREYLTALVIENGLIVLIEPDGNIGMYRQRGIGQLSNELKRLHIKAGLLSPEFANYKELPKNWSISFEDEEIMGKARATFKVVQF